jgi:hypothetical protein
VPKGGDQLDGSYILDDTSIQFGRVLEEEADRELGIKKPDRSSRFVTDASAGICDNCEWWFDEKIGCKAFPDGIPLSVLTGEFQHTTPYKGDGGILFKRKKK